MSAAPSEQHSHSPSHSTVPSASPSFSPSGNPSNDPSFSPSTSLEPSWLPSSQPSKSVFPSSAPSSSPSRCDAASDVQGYIIDPAYLDLRFINTPNSDGLIDKGPMSPKCPHCIERYYRSKIDCNTSGTTIHSVNATELANNYHISVENGEGQAIFTRLDIDPSGAL
eukprot:11971141-Ditylum_brightwellii.AAC.1